ncbi:MAG TPA: thiolase family protein, partial [Acidimicrobiia bacterium]|nr:thiolase family protein [Acidimicrobiia bacterium]
VDGIVCANDVRESNMFLPATIAEYCGFAVDFAERVDLGGASAVGMVWRAAVAVELGICDVVVGALTARPVPEPPEPVPVDPRVMYGASSNLWGSPQAEFEIPYGNIAQNAGYAMIAQRYGAQFGYDPRATAKIAVDQRTNALANPAAIFHDQPITVDDVLDSRMIADPLHLLEIVMPCVGGGAFVVAGREHARRARERNAFVAGFGEHLTHKTHTYMPDLTSSPVGPAARQAFAMAGIGPSDVDVAELYDCYTITVLLSIEDSGFCAKGDGMRFVRDHDLTYAGDFPVNTHGGQLGFGQPGVAGGLSQVLEGVRQVRGDAGAHQVPGCDTAYVSGTGGIMSEQSALVLVAA